MKNIFNNRRFKHGSLATIITIGFIILVVIINVIATALLERYPLNIDLTADNRFKLTNESVKYIENLKNDVKITVCYDELEYKSMGDFYKQIYEILKDYSKHNKKIDLQFVDLHKNPTFSQKYLNQNIQMGDILIESNNKVRKISNNDLVQQEQTSYGDVVYSSQAEQVVTSAIMYVTSEKQTTVSLLGGLNNANIDSYAELLRKNNYEVIEQNILTDEINKDADLVVLSAPDADLSADQVKKLENYLDNDGKFGKSLVYIADVQKPVKPVLASFLAEWGMKVEEAVALETNSGNILYNNPSLMVNKFNDEEILKQLKTDKLPLVVGNVTPVKVLFDEKDNRKTQVLAMSSDSNILVPFKEVDKNLDPKKYTQSALSSIVKGTREKYIGSDLVNSNVVVFGSSAMFENEFLLNPGYNNGNIVIALTDTLTQKEAGVTILPVEFGQETITITKAQQIGYTVVFKYLLPLAVIIAGIVIWLRRRHL